MNKTNVKDYLNSIKSGSKGQLAADNKLMDDPAALFVNSSDGKFGSIFLFERFGQADSDTYRITSQITDHYMEDNVSRQDHWSIAPDIYIMSGFIGEVVYQPPKKWKNFVSDHVVDYLKPLSILSPAFDSYTQSALNVVQAVETSYRRYEQIARNIFDNFDTTAQNSKRTNQRYVMQLLKTCQLNRQLVTVWTPYSTFDNMAIQNASISQANTKYKSRLEVEFKQWRKISSNNTREATEKEKQDYLAQVQKMKEQEQGTAATQNVEKVTNLSIMLGVGDYKR